MWPTMSLENRKLLLSLISQSQIIPSQLRRCSPPHIGFATLLLGGVGLLGPMHQYLTSGFGTLSKCLSTHISERIWLYITYHLSGAMSQKASRRFPKHC